jgi:hypothetical protein
VPAVSPLSLARDGFEAMRYRSPRLFRRLERFAVGQFLFRVLNESKANRDVVLR